MKTFKNSKTSQNLKFNEKKAEVMGFNSFVIVKALTFVLAYQAVMILKGKVHIEIYLLINFLNMTIENSR